MRCLPLGEEKGRLKLSNPCNTKFRNPSSAGPLGEGPRPTEVASRRPVEVLAEAQGNTATGGRAHGGDLLFIPRTSCAHPGGA